MKEYKSSISELQLKRIPSYIKKAKIKTSEEAAQYCMNFFDDDLTIYESFFMVMLNNANNTIAYVKISQGGVIGTVIDISLIAKYAIESLSRSVILCHNHPSGSKIPSNADINLTDTVVKALKLFEIKVLDHIILTETEYYSFRDEGKLY